MGLFVEAGILVGKASARMVLQGIVGKKLKNKDFVIEKDGTLAKIAGAESHVSNNAVPYGKISFWNRAQQPVVKKRQRRRMLGALYERARRAETTAKASSRSPMAAIMKRKSTLEAEVEQNGKEMEEKADNLEVIKVRKQNSELKKNIAELNRRDAELKKKTAKLEAKVEQKADSAKVNELREQNAKLSTSDAELKAEVKELKAHMGIVEGVVKSLRTNRPYPKKPAARRTCSNEAITPHWYSELLSEDRRREVAGCATIAANLDLESTNAVDIKDLALDGGVAVHEETALLELGSPQEVLDKHFVYKVEGEAPFVKESDLLYNFITKQTEAVYDCKTTAKQVCEASEKVGTKSKIKVIVYEDKEWCCKSNAYNTCVKDHKECISKLKKPRTYHVDVEGTKDGPMYSVVSAGRRRRLLVRGRRGC
jgi:hypothetical protein